MMEVEPSYAADLQRTLMPISVWHSLKAAEDPNTSRRTIFGKARATHEIEMTRSTAI